MTARGARVVDATITFEDFPLRAVMAADGESLCEATVAECILTLEDEAGRTATGRGAVTLLAGWAWPSQKLSHLQRVDAMQQMCLEIADRMPVWCRELRHPLEHGMDARGWVDGLAIPVGKRLFITERIPALAAYVCLSPFDQALHDAHGRLHGISSYETLGRGWLPGDLSRWLGEVGEGRFLDELNFRRERQSLDAWLTVGPDDPLGAAAAPDLADDLPVSVESWIARCGYRCFKVVTSGTDCEAGAAWLADVYREIAAIRADLGLAGGIRFAVDMSEGCEGPWAVTEFLDALETADPEAYGAIQYLEQPTERGLGANAWDMRPISARKPVFAGAGVAELADLSFAAELGWSGPALRTATGHSFVLLAIAWCKLTGRPYVLQDLLNPGIGAVQAAGMAAHCDTLNGIELAGMQRFPSASRAETARFPRLFQVRDGVHGVDGLGTVGLLY